MVMHLKSCCCGCSLRTGTLIIGFTSLFGSVSGIITSSWNASESTEEYQKKGIEELEKQRGSMSPAEYDHAIRELEGTTGNNTLSAFYICFIVIYATRLIFDILLIDGASAERPRMIKPWLIYNTLLLLVQFIGGLVVITYLFIAGAVGLGVRQVVMFAVGYLTEIYFILVVNSFHTELLSNNSQNTI